MITRKFIEKVHGAFDELNYHETKTLDFKKFETAAVDTLTRCKEITDATTAVRMYHFCLKKWKKIEKLFAKKLDAFNENDYEGRALISTVSEENAIGTYYITNGITNKVNEILIASKSFDDMPSKSSDESLCAVNYKKGSFFVFDNGDYHLKHSNLSSTVMKLFDKSNNCLCNIVLSSDLGIFLENNTTQYSIVLYDNILGVFDRDYIESLKSDRVNMKKCLAEIEWDIVEKNSDCGVAKLSLYAPEDLEMLLFFAMSTFLLYQRYRQAKRNAMMYMSSSLWR